MGAEKHGSKGGAAHVGGWLQLFDWNAKSRKKLFSSKSSSSELSKQKKRCDGNMPVTLQHLVAEDDILTGSSMRGSSECDYSCASSLTDEELGVPRPPSVVARLMGLDSFTMPNVRDVYTSSNFDTQSLQDSRFHSRYQGSHPLFHSGNLHHKMDDPVRNALEQKHQKISNRPIEKFQAEILPPKSAKSIPITHHKLLSPIKNANFVSSENAAHIMEVAARVIGPGPQVTAKPKLSAVGSSSVPLRVRDLKEKVQAAQKQTKLAEASHLPRESNAFKHPNGASRDKNRNGSADAISEGGSSNSEASRPNKKGKSKSISLALQAKANIQKRERLYSSGSRSQVDQKELNEGLSSESFKHEPRVQKCTQKRPSSLGSSRVLQQNNQKQNCSADKGKMLSKESLPKSQVRKPVNRDSSVARYKCASKSNGNSRVVSRRSRSEAMEGNSEDSYSTSRNISRKKRSVDANIQVENTVNGEETWINGNEKLVQSGLSREKERNLMIEENKRKGTDVVSFTFSAPMTRSVHEHEAFREAQKKKFGFDADFQSKKSSHSRDDVNNKFSSSQCNVIGSDALSSLLDRTLKELNHGLDASLNKPRNGNASPSTFQASLDALPTMASLQDDCKTQDSRQTDEFGTDLSSAFSSTDLQRIIMKHKIQGLDLEINKYPRKYIEAKDMVEYPLPSPFSVLENSFFTESCNSSDTADSFTTGGSKQSSSVQAQEFLGACPSDADAELNDSASSISARTSAMKGCTSSSSDSCLLTKCELGYVKEILSDIEVKFMNFSLGRTEKIIDTHIFNQLKNQNRFVEKNIPSPRQKVLFDCVAECIDTRCKPHTGGGCKTWMEGMHMVKRKERLAEDIYKEISGWSSMGDSMVDELVDKDMSSKYGRWLDFETEASELGKHIENRILNMLLDEVIADIL